MTRRFFFFLQQNFPKVALFITLCVLSCLFAMPFVWMLMGSLKSDEERQQAHFFPSFPRACLSSPHLAKGQVFVKAPEGVSQEKWRKLKPVLQGLCRKLVLRDAPFPHFLSPKEEEELRRQVSLLLLARGCAKMPHVQWQEQLEEIPESFYQALESGKGLRGELDASYAKAFAHLGIESISVRGGGKPLVHWGAQQLSGKLLATGKGAITKDSQGRLIWHYRFTDKGQEACLSAEFSSSLIPETIEGIELGIHQDASWNRLEVLLEYNGKRWVNQTPIWLSKNSPRSIFFHLGASQSISGKRVAIDLLEDNVPSALLGNQSHLKLTLRLLPSSNWQAGWAKATHHYRRVFSSMPFLHYVGNSLIITLLSILGSVVSSCLVAYAFSRLEWPGRSLAFLLLLATMMLPSQVTMIPQFIIWRELGLYNTLVPLWFPTWGGVAFFIFLMVQQMRGIPKELEEAARIDGMNPLQIWWHVIIPLVYPSMAAIAIMSFMGAWNEFMAPLIYLRDMEKFPLSVGMYALGVDTTSAGDMGLILAGNFLMTLPVLLIFFFFQRYFIQGIASTGVKG